MSDGIRFQTGEEARLWAEAFDNAILALGKTDAENLGDLASAAATVADLKLAKMRKRASERESS